MNKNFHLFKYKCRDESLLQKPKKNNQIFCKWTFPIKEGSLPLALTGDHKTNENLIRT